MANETAWKSWGYPILHAQCIFLARSLPQGNGTLPNVLAFEVLPAFGLYVFCFYDASSLTVFSNSSKTCESRPCFLGAAPSLDAPSVAIQIYQDTPSRRAAASSPMSTSQCRHHNSENAWKWQESGRHEDAKSLEVLPLVKELRCSRLRASGAPVCVC